MGIPKQPIVKIIGETANRKSKYEMFNLLFVIEDYIKIKKSLKNKL